MAFKNLISVPDIQKNHNFKFESLSIQIWKIRNSEVLIPSQI